MFMKTTLVAAALTLGATSAFAAEKYTFDPSHSQIVFTYDHLGFSTTTSMFSGFEGEIMMDEEEPANSSVRMATWSMQIREQSWRRPIPWRWSGVRPRR